MIERLSTADGAHVLLNWASANLDRNVWEDVDRMDLHRPRTPHLGFGFGRHSCLGKPLAEREILVFLSVLLEEWPGWILDGDPEIEWVPEGDVAYLARFDALRVRVEA